MGCCRICKICMSQLIILNIIEQCYVMRDIGGGGGVGGGDGEADDMEMYSLALSHI